MNPCRRGVHHYYFRIDTFSSSHSTLQAFLFDSHFASITTKKIVHHVMVSSIYIFWNEHIFRQIIYLGLRKVQNNFKHSLLVTLWVGGLKLQKSDEKKNLITCNVVWT